MKMNATKMLITSIDVSSGIINNAAPRMGPKKIRVGVHLYARACVKTGLGVGLIQLKHQK